MSCTRQFALSTKPSFADLIRNMKKLSPTTHGILDYVTVLFLLISPSLLKMETPGSNLTYALAFVHLILTLLTDFPVGALKLIPLRIHGLIEVIVSFGLLAVAISFRILGYSVSFYFYLVFCVVLLIIWTISEYKIGITHLGKDRLLSHRTTHEIE
jgi:hypothetical protein